VTVKIKQDYIPGSNDYERCIPLQTPYWKPQLQPETRWRVHNKSGRKNV